MMSRIFIGLLASAALGACGAIRSEIPNEPADYSNLQPMEFELGDFSEIRISANAELKIRQGENFRVQISTEPDHADALEARVRGNRLIIEHPDRRHSKRHVVIDIETPSLDTLEIDAATDALISDINADHFEINFSGVGEVIVRGQCESLDLTISGIGDFDASEFYCAEADVDISGIGSAGVYASEAVDVRASGIGDVTIYGAPPVRNRDVSGLGSVDFVGGRRAVDDQSEQEGEGFDHDHADHHKKGN